MPGSSRGGGVVWMPLPLRVGGTLETRKVSQVSCGAFHSAAVTADGACFTWGEGAFYALGHGAGGAALTPSRGAVLSPLGGTAGNTPDNTPCSTPGGKTSAVVSAGKAGAPGAELVPRQVAGLAGRRVLRVSCGVWHTAAIVQGGGGGDGAAAGELWSWGDAEGGKLGHGGGKEPVAVPRRVAFPGGGGDALTRVSCGQWHTLALEVTGALWVCGQDLTFVPFSPQLPAVLSAP